MATPITQEVTVDRQNEAAANQTTPAPAGAKGRRFVGRRAAQAKTSAENCEGAPSESDSQTIVVSAGNPKVFRSNKANTGSSGPTVTSVIEELEKDQVSMSIF